MHRWLKVLLFLFVIKPIVLIILGLNRIYLHPLPKQGPIILAANHNSHLDTLVLMALFPWHLLHRVRPVAAADYFLKNKWLAWVSLNIIGIIPLYRHGEVDKQHVFDDCFEALDNDDILIIFPEGSRGEPEQLSDIKKGLYYCLQQRPNTPLLPILMRGLGHSLPKGTELFVPFNCDVIIGKPSIYPQFKNADDFVNQMTLTYKILLTHCITETAASHSKNKKDLT